VLREKRTHDAPPLSCAGMSFARYARGDDWMMVREYRALEHGSIHADQSHAAS
jgi:hypothetical protein